MKKEQPIHQPISNLPLIANIMDAEYLNTVEHFKTLSQARGKPHVLNDAIIARVIKIYTEKFDFMWVYEDQLAKWHKETLTHDQQNEIIRLQEQVKKLKKVVMDILALAEELKMGTIEKVMAKSDLEMGIEFLDKLSKGKPLF